MVCKKLLRLTQHKRFSLQVHPNFYFAKTSFMLGTLDDVADKDSNLNVG